MPPCTRTARSALAQGLLALALSLCGTPGFSQTASAPSGAGDAVARGAYLARAGDCVSCHTAPGGAPMAGGYRLDTPFGYLLSPNITPDTATGIGLWSADDFYRALHQGVNRRGQDMYPVMPFDFYTRITRADSDALWAYLRSVPPVKNVDGLLSLTPTTLLQVLNGLKLPIFQFPTPADSPSIVSLFNGLISATPLSYA